MGIDEGAKSIGTETEITVYLRSDDAYRARVSDALYPDSFFSRVYIRANRLICEMTEMMNCYDNESMEGGEEVDNARSMGNNIILFTAARGQGKTSAMSTFAAYLANGKHSELIPEGESSCLNSKKYEVLGLIDPTMMNQSESIVRVFLSRLFLKFEAVVRREEIKEHSASESNRGMKRIEILEQFSKCYDNVNFLESPDKNYLEQNDLDSLARLGSSTELRKNLRRLVAKYLEYVDGTEALPNVGNLEKKNGQITKGKRYLVLEIDDADLSARNIFDICEQIREYLRIPGVIVLMAADFSQLRNSVFQEYLTQYKNLRKLQKRIEIVDTCYRKTWRYLEKMFPEGHRIYLPDIGDVLRHKSQNVRIQYKNAIDGMTIDLNYEECCDIQEQLLRLIYDRTGLVFLKKDRGMRSLFPETMRQLTHFLMEMGEMQPVNHQELLRDYFNTELNDPVWVQAEKQRRILETNLDRFYNYFFHEWIYSRVEKKIFDILQDIMKVKGDAAEACRIIDKYLAKARKKRSKDEKAEPVGIKRENEASGSAKEDIAERKEPYENIKPANAMKVLVEKIRELEKTDVHCENLYDAVSMYYSIKMNQGFLELMRYGESELLQQLGDFSFYSAEYQSAYSTATVLPSYYHFVIDHENGADVRQMCGVWADLFLANAGAGDGRKESGTGKQIEVFDIWNVITNVLRLIPDRKKLQSIISPMSSGKKNDNNEGALLLGVRLVATNVDVRDRLSRLFDEQRQDTEENASFVDRIISLYKLFDLWHKSERSSLETVKSAANRSVENDFRNIPDGFKRLCGYIEGDKSGSLSFIFLSNRKNYVWYCLLYARNIRDGYEKIRELAGQYEKVQSVVEARRFLSSLVTSGIKGSVRPIGMSEGKGKDGALRPVLMERKELKKLSSMENELKWCYDTLEKLTKTRIVTAESVRLERADDTKELKRRIDDGEKEIEDFMNSLKG